MTISPRPPSDAPPMLGDMIAEMHAAAAAPPAPLHIGGLDASLTGTGLARIYRGALTTWVCQPKKLRGFPRLEHLIEQVLAYLGGCAVVGVEGLAFGAKGNAVLDLAGLRQVLTLELHRAGITMVDISPAVVKKYATGSHMADKTTMYGAALRRLEPYTADLGRTIATEDEADAAWLAHAVADHYGQALVAMPAAQRAALDAVTKTGRRKGLPVVSWPDVPAGLFDAAALAANRKR